MDISTWADDLNLPILNAEEEGLWQSSGVETRSVSGHCFAGGIFPASADSVRDVGMEVKAFLPSKDRTVQPFGGPPLFTRPRFSSQVFALTPYGSYGSKESSRAEPYCLQNVPSMAR